jgi:hypothetical protein
MKYSDPFRRLKLINNNPKNRKPCASMEPISINRNNLLNSKTENKSIKKLKRNKLLSSSSLNQNNRYNYIQNNYYHDIKNYKESSYLKYNKHLNLAKNKKNKNKNIYPPIYLNRNEDINNANLNNNYYKNYLNNDIKRECSTFYSLGNNINSNFLLDKRIKIINDPQQQILNLNEENDNINIIDDHGISNSSRKISFNKLLPNDLRIYRGKLFNNTKKRVHRSKSQESIPTIEVDKMSNKKMNSCVGGDNNKTKSSDLSKNIEDEKNFENIEVNGRITKVMTKLPTDKDINNSSRSSKNISDYHNIMKHPFIIESYGYDFLRNLKDEYKIYRNPFDDKELIYNIHNLIINPNTKKFRNDNLIIGADFYKRKNNKEIDKDYKSLSKQGYKRLQNDIKRNLRKNVEKSILNMKRIKCDLDILMENNIKKFKEHREELINEEL